MSKLFSINALWLTSLGLICCLVLLSACTKPGTQPETAYQEPPPQEKIEISPAYQFLKERDPGQRAVLLDPGFGEVTVVAGTSYTSAMGQECIQGRVEYATGDTEQIAICKHHESWRPVSRIFIPWDRKQAGQEGRGNQQYRETLDLCPPPASGSGDLDLLPVLNSKGSLPTD